MSVPVDHKQQHDAFENNERDGKGMPHFLAESGIQGARQHIDLNSPTTRHDIMSAGDSVEDDVEIIQGSDGAKHKHGKDGEERSEAQPRVGQGRLAKVNKASPYDNPKPY